MHERIADLLEQGRADAAEREAAHARRRHPQDAELARLHGLALYRLGQPAEALQALEDAQRLAPQAFEIACNLGSVRLAEGDAEGAMRSFAAADRLAPGHPAVQNGLGNARRAVGDLVGARAAYARALAAAPGHPGALCNLAAAELALGDAQAAERLARQALTAAPEYPEALLVLGHALAAQARHAQARQAYRAGEQSSGGDPRFAYQAGLMAEEMGQLAEAADAHTRALARDPHFDAALGQLAFLRRQLCDWRDIDVLSGRVRERVAAGAQGLSPFAFLAEPARADEQLAVARLRAGEIEMQAAPLRARLDWRFAPRDRDAPLRLGFMARGFGNHPTALLVVALFEALRQEAVEVHAFSTVPDDGSALGARVQRAVRRFHPLAFQPAQTVAEAIRAADIDVLLDLDGYCEGALPTALALRPARVQVNWLAYPGTLGAPWIDYVLADAVVLPESLHPHFSETVAWLPRCFQPNDPTRAIAPAPSRAQCGLPEHAVVFACFNNSFKLGPATFERLLAVLRGVPDSVLWLLAGPPGADVRLRAEAARRGIDPQRLVFAPKVEHAAHLARHACADLFLDTAPYGAHTTASDALWAGCPVLTVAGEVFAARVAASLVHHLGMPECIRADDADFVAEAIRLGNDPAARAALRTRLAAQRQTSGLFDMRGYARDFVITMQRMRDRHAAGLAPAPLR